MEKLYRVQMNKNGMPNFSTAEEVEPNICDFCRYYNSNIPCGTTPSACKKTDKFAEEFVDGLKKLKPDDLIRRSDAIKAYNDNLETSEVGTMLDDEKYLQALQSIPAVEQKRGEVNAVKEYEDAIFQLEHNKISLGEYESLIEPLKHLYAVEPCKDPVSREWLLNELEEMNVANFYEANFHSNEMYGQMKRMIKAAPSVTVDPKKGEWIRTVLDFDMVHPELVWKCSECGKECYIRGNFCANCGAKMKGADDE